MNSKKKLLIITYNFYPQSSNQSNKLELLIPYLKKHYEQIDVLTSWHYGLRTMENMGGINIHRINHKLLTKQYNAANNNSSVTNEHKSLLKSVCKKIIHLLIWPDFAFLWIRRAFNKAKHLHHENKYTHVLSLCFPFSCHLVAYKLKKQYPELKFMCDYIDPFAVLENCDQSSNNSLLYKKINWFMEGRVNLCADRVMMSYESIRAYPEKRLTRFKGQLYESTPWLALDEKRYQEAQEDYFSFSQKQTLLYIGTLYNKIRNPEFSLKILSQALDSSSEAYYVGIKNDCSAICEEYKNSYPTTFNMLDKVDKSEALSMLKSADILIFIDNQQAKQLPSKIVEYLYTNKKILLFIKNLLSPTYIYLKEKNLLSDNIFIINESNFNSDSFNKLRSFISLNAPMTNKNNIDFSLYNSVSNYII